jgi:hypothetical protein
MVARDRLTARASIRGLPVRAEERVAACELTGAGGEAGTDALNVGVAAIFAGAAGALVGWNLHRDVPATGSERAAVI